MLEPQCNDQANRLREEGRRFYDDKYKGHFDNLITRTGDWFRAMGDDPLNKRVGEDWARLTHDLLFDSDGSLKWKPELWMDIRKVILPSIIERVSAYNHRATRSLIPSSSGRLHSYPSHRVYRRRARRHY